MTTMLEPVTWGDIERLRLQFNLTQADLFHAFGIRQAKWKEITRNNRFDQVVPDPTLALLYRIYEANPAALPGRQIISMREIYQQLTIELQGHPELLDDDNNIKTRFFGPLLGRNSPAGYAWLRDNQPPSQQIILLWQAVQKVGGGEVLFGCVLTELKARGVNPFKTGRWSTSTDHE